MFARIAAAGPLDTAALRVLRGLEKLLGRRSHVHRVGSGGVPDPRWVAQSGVLSTGLKDFLNNNHDSHTVTERYRRVTVVTVFPGLFKATYSLIGWRGDGGRSATVSCEVGLGAAASPAAAAGGELFGAAVRTRLIRIIFRA